MSEHAERAAARVYGGVWLLLARLFRVPRGAPTLPRGGADVVRSFHPSPAFLSYLKFWFWIVLLAIDGALLVLWIVVMVASPVAGIVVAPVFLVVMVVPDIVAYVAIHLRYDTTWYVMSDRSLRCRRGIWIICEHTVTFENVQDVRVQRGPVQQSFGIASVVVETAGSSSEGEHERRFSIGNRAVLEGIDNPDEIRGLIMDRVSRSRTTGLGDEHDEGRGSSRWGREEVALLREIRDEVRAMAPGA